MDASRSCVLGHRHKYLDSSCKWPLNSLSPKDTLGIDSVPLPITDSTMAKLLTVFGATGQQGGALIRYVVKTPSLSSAFTLRGVTRDASKAASIALKDLGVEMVEVS